MKVPMPKKSSKLPRLESAQHTTDRRITKEDLDEFVADVARFNTAWKSDYKVRHFSYLMYEGAYLNFSATWIFKEAGVEKYAHWVRRCEGDKLTDEYFGAWIPN